MQRMQVVSHSAATIATCMQYEEEQSFFAEICIQLSASLRSKVQEKMVAVNIFDLLDKKT